MSGSTLCSIMDIIVNALSLSLLLLWSATKELENREGAEECEICIRGDDEMIKKLNFQ